MTVAFLTNAGALAIKHRVLAGMNAECYRGMAQEFAQAMEVRAVALSSGALSSATLAKMGHPYSKRLPANSAPTPDFIINIQSGDFIGGWHSRAQMNELDWTVSIWNDSEHAKYMLGTKRMRERPILEQVTLDLASLCEMGTMAALEIVANAGSSSGSKTTKNSVTSAAASLATRALSNGMPPLTPFDTAGSASTGLPGSAMGSVRTFATRAASLGIVGSATSIVMPIGDGSALLLSILAGAGSVGSALASQDYTP